MYISLILFTCIVVWILSTIPLNVSWFDVRQCIADRVAGVEQWD